MDAIKVISYFFNLSSKRQEHLEKLIKENFPEITRKKEILEEIFFNLEGKYNKDILLLKQTLF